ncbi:hypothetical protein [Chryseobacterium geocarposphaerae]|uniref:Uncharacterized protein n=1 Tax=Chryseobacterium geocarposphaerae TaxID=1416776 RepID=A0A2M9C9J6_9FLAO|nr:hypothetical protein [Chryseobacterium geocarposphaerae]PJJ67495.1 hypothetical protein CLV73_1510 [Chryseobacterium geocarposphaerae]
MKLNILKAEVIFQTLLTFISLTYVIFDYVQKTEGTEFFIALFFIGVSNLLGFLLRISLVGSQFHRYYFFGVILFFLILYSITSLTVDSHIEFAIYFMGVGGMLFNVYYLVYGFCLIKTMKQNKIAE